MFIFNNVFVCLFVWFAAWQINKWKKSFFLVTHKSIGESEEKKSFKCFQIFRFECAHIWCKMNQKCLAIMKMDTEKNFFFLDFSLLLFLKWITESESERDKLMENIVLLLNSYQKTTKSISAVFVLFCCEYPMINPW